MIPTHVPTTIAAAICGLSRAAFVRHVRPRLSTGPTTWVSLAALADHLDRDISAEELVTAQASRQGHFRRIGE